MYHSKKSQVNSYIRELNHWNSDNSKLGEVVKIYVRDEYASVVRPVMELKRFKRITLDPEEKKTGTFALDKDVFAFYDERTKD